MLWNKEEKYDVVPYDKESDLEDAVNESKTLCLVRKEFILTIRKKSGKREELIIYLMGI